MGVTYKEQRLIKAALKPSPSLIYNNLCSLGSGLAFAHTRAVATLGKVPASDGAAVEGKRIDTQDTSQVQAARTCVVHGAPILALGNEKGLQVWDETGSQLLFVWKLPASCKANTQHADFVRGITFNVSADGEVQLLAGCSSGAIQVFSVAPGPIIKHTTTLTHHTAPIVALGSAFQSRRGGDWAEDLGCQVVSADDRGGLVVWQADSAHVYSMVRSVESSGVPVCSVAVRKGFIVCGRTDGTVRLYGLKDGKLRSEIHAHSRWLSAMDIHPHKDVIATVSEDCSLNLWELPIEGNQATSLLSTTWTNALLTGVVFCGAGNDDVAAVAYDTDEISVWQAIRV